MPEHNGHEYDVQRRETDSGGYEYEFHLVVDGEDVTTATELERQGHNGPEDGGVSWTVHLRRYAHAYIDGLEA